MARRRLLDPGGDTGKVMKRAWVWWLLVVAAVWLLIGRSAELEKLAGVLHQGQWEWLLAASALQILFFLLYAELYHSALLAVEVESRTLELLPVWFISLFVNLAAPGTGGAIILDDAAQRGQSSARAAAGVILVRVADFGTFAVILAAGMVYLFTHHDLKRYEIAGAGALVVIICGWSALLLLGLWRSDLLQRLLGIVQGLMNGAARLVHRPGFVGSDWAGQAASDFAAAAVAIVASPKQLLRTLAVAMAGHLVSLLSLYVLFLAFHRPIGPGTLVAGFGMGMLFWIVAITPEGVGVVEGVMTLAFASLGVPLERAAVVTLAFRGLSFWMPLLFGLFFVRRLASSGQTRAQQEAWSIRVVAALTALMGAVNVLSAATPTLAARMRLVRELLPLSLRYGSHFAATLAGFALLLLAQGIWRRKKTAWVLTEVILVISVVSHLLKGLDYEEAALAGGVAIWLLALRSHFHARSDPTTIRRGILVLAYAVLFTFAYGIVGFYLLDRHFSIDFGFRAALRQTGDMFFQFKDPGLQPITTFGRYFGNSIYAVGATTLGYALIALLRPVLTRRPSTDAERKHAAQIVRDHGRSSLAMFALMDDKSYFFSQGGSVVAYVAKGRTGLALGDPIGPGEDAAAAIREFERHCAESDWRAAFYQTLPDYLPHYRAAGFDVLCVGHEAIVDMRSFDLATVSKSIRSAVSKLDRSGYRVQHHTPPLSQELLEELRSVSDEWLSLMRGSEKRFSLGWFDDDYVRNGPVMAVYDSEDSVVAFANIVPEYQLNECTTDLMRRRRNVENGTMDFLFVRFFEWARDNGYDTFNLGLSPLAGVGENQGDPVVARALHFIYQHMNQFYHFQGLHAFKSKFHPVWSPRFLVYPGAPALAAVAIAIIRADSGDDILARLFP